MEKKESQIKVEKYNESLYHIKISEYLSNKSISVFLKEKEYKELLEKMKNL